MKFKLRNGNKEVISVPKQITITLKGPRRKWIIIFSFDRYWSYPALNTMKSIIELNSVPRKELNWESMIASRKKEVIIPTKKNLKKVMRIFVRKIIANKISSSPSWGLLKDAIAMERKIYKTPLDLFELWRYITPEVKISIPQYENISFPGRETR